MSDPVVADNQAESRYEISLDGAVVGMAYYQREPGRVIFTHTEVSPEVGGQGIGSALAGYALDDARARGEQAVPLCPFIAAHIKRHPDYLDLVPPEFRHRVGA